MRAAKSITALALTGIGTALVVGFQVPETTVATPAVTATTTTTTATASGSGSTGTGTGTTSGSGTAEATPAATESTTSTTVTTATSTAYADGTWTGTAVDEPWGTFQVQAVISGGQLTDVVVVTSPQDHHSARINDQAIPVLTEAAIASQGAEVDLISGATWTSESYAASLQGALDAARAAAESAA